MALKYPLTNYTNKQHNLTRQNDNSIEKPTDKSQIFGICAGVFLIVSILYMYYTSRKKLRLKITNNSSSYTFSEAIENAEKIGSVILIVIFLAFLQGLFTIQNFNGVDFERVSLICVNYVVILGILLLFYVGPNKHMGHGLIALILTLTVVYSSSMINVLYHRYYTADSLYNLNLINYIIIAVFVLLIVVFVVFILSRHTGKYYVVVHHLLSICELLLLLLYAVFLIFFGQLPKLMSDSDLQCTFNI